MRLWTMLLIVVSAFASCDSILDGPKEDCSVEYRVKFKYDNNMKFADAFAHEVRSVTLYAFDEAGKFVYQRTEQGGMLANDGYSMPVEISPGDYHLVTWAGLEGEESFSVPILTPGVSTIENLTCSMNRKHLSRATDGSAYVDADLKPLFHGEVVKQSFTRAGFTQTTTISLTKNTNNIRIVLQQMSGEAVDIDQFVYTIEDENGLMNYDNTILKDENLTYYAWSITSGTAEINQTRTGNDGVSVAIAELTVGRLVKGKKPILKITNSDGEQVLAIPLIDYALLVKGNYNRQMDDQEYLDRQDEYNMTFFLDKQNHWISSSIIINGWKVVLNDSDLN